MQSKPKRRLLRATEDPGVFQLDIDNTSLETTVCPRMGQFRMVQGRELASGQGPLIYGNAKHRYLEKRLLGSSVQEAQQAMVDFMLDNPFEDEWRNIHHALEGMQRYEERWASQPINVMELRRTNGPLTLVEVPFQLPLVEIEVGDVLNFPQKLLVEGSTSDEPLAVDKIVVNWTGKIDTVWQDHPTLGGNWIVDHKTTSIGGVTFWGEFQLSQQTVGYTWAARKLLPEVPIRGAIVNALIGRKPTKTGVAHEFDRMEFEYPDWQTDEWHNNTASLCRDFVHHLMDGFFPMRTKSCFGKYGKCRYHDVCSAAPEARPTILFSGLYQDVTWNPLEE